jgi:hypothetical protein
MIDAPWACRRPCGWGSECSAVQDEEDDEDEEEEEEEEEEASLSLPPLSL